MKLSSYISGEYLDEVKIRHIAKSYRNNTPYPHLQIDDFFREEVLERITEALAEEDLEFKESDLFSLSQTQQLTFSQNRVLREFCDFLNSSKFRDYMRNITGVASTPGELDLFGAVYGRTDYLLCHDDQLGKRKVAFIIYLTGLEEGEGGKLVLYTDADGKPGKVVKSYTPKKNSFMFFTVSDKSWHEVEEVTADTFRVSIGGWLNE